MLQTLCKKIGICLATFILIIVTCTSCKTEEIYKKSEYINDLAFASGINESNDTDESFESLLLWNVVCEEDYELLEEQLDYGFLARTITSLLEDGSSDKLLVLKDYGWIDEKVKDTTSVDKETANGVIEKAVDYINNPVVKKEYYAKEKDNVYTITDYETTKDKLTYSDNLDTGNIVFLKNDGIYKKIVGYQDGTYLLGDVEYQDVFEYMNLADSFEVDFTNAEITPYGNIEESNYENANFNLLASNNKSSFDVAGFRVSFSVLSSGLSVHLSKTINKLNIYTDLSVNKVNPTVKWTYEKGDLKNCFFKVDFNTCEEFGVSTGKYKSFYLDFKNLDSSSFLKNLRSRVSASDDYAEATIPICKIKTPIPNVPFIYLNFDVLIRIYVSGRAEIVFSNTHEIGFETKEGNIRFINESSKDVDFVAYASAKATAGLAFGVEAAGFRLFDIELDGGLGFTVRSTMHLYDDDGEDTIVESDISYAALDEISKENNNVRICADISFHWVLDLQINTSRTLLYKIGLSKKISFLDEDDTVFGNLHHIENGKFVEKCTRKGRTKIKTTTSTIDSNKIILEKYSAVIKMNSTYQINVITLPSGYTTNDLIYLSSDNAIAKTSGNTIIPVSKGSTKVRVYTKDNKYEAYINVLVSDG